MFIDKHDKLFAKLLCHEILCANDRHSPWIVAASGATNVHAIAIYRHEPIADVMFSGSLDVQKAIRAPEAATTCIN